MQLQVLAKENCFQSLHVGQLGHTGKEPIPILLGFFVGGMHSFSHPAFGLVKFMSVKESMDS